MGMLYGFQQRPSVLSAVYEVLSGPHGEEPLQILVRALKRQLYLDPTVHLFNDIWSPMSSDLAVTDSFDKVPDRPQGVSGLMFCSQTPE